MKFTHSLVSILMVVLPCGIVGLLGGVARVDGGIAMVMVGVASWVGRGRGYGCCCLVLLHDLEVGRQRLVTQKILQTPSTTTSKRKLTMYNHVHVQLPQGYH